MAALVITKDSWLSCSHGPPPGASVANLALPSKLEGGRGAGDAGRRPERSGGQRLPAAQLVGHQAVHPCQQHDGGGPEAEGRGPRRVHRGRGRLYRRPARPATAGPGLLGHRPPPDQVEDGVAMDATQEARTLGRTFGLVDVEPGARVGLRPRPGADARRRSGPHPRDGRRRTRPGPEGGAADPARGGPVPPGLRIRGPARPDQDGGVRFTEELLRLATHAGGRRRTPGSRLVEKVEVVPHRRRSGGPGGSTWRRGRSPTRSSP